MFVTLHQWALSTDPSCLFTYFTTHLSQANKVLQRRETLKMVWPSPNKKRNDIIRTLDESYLTKITRFKKSSLGMKYFIIGLINAWSLVSYNLYSYGRMKFLRNLPFSAKYQLAMSSLASHKTCKFISKKWHFVSVLVGPTFLRFYSSQFSSMQQQPSK